MKIFDYWRLSMFSEHREHIYKTYCDEIKHVRRYYPLLSDSKCRRQAVMNLADDFYKTLSDFTITVNEWIRSQEDEQGHL